MAKAENTDDADKTRNAVKSNDEPISDRERVDRGNILVRVVIEVLGAPRAHVEESVQIVVDKIHRIQNITVVSEKTYEAEEKDNGLFSTFSELEIWFNSVEQCMEFLFNFTPSSIELIQPENLSWSNNVFSGFANDFLMKMHDSGMKLSDTSAKLALLKKNTDALITNFVTFSLDKPRSADELAKILGIPEDNVKAILDNFLKAGVASENNGVYSLIKK